MAKAALAAVLLVFSTASFAVPYTITIDGTQQFPTDTATFTTGITPGAYQWVRGQNFSHVHQMLTVPIGDLFIGANWANSLWLTLDGTNSIEYDGYERGSDPRNLLWHTVRVTPGAPPLVGPVPEPGTLGLLALGVAAVIVGRRRQLRQ